MTISCFVVEFGKQRQCFSSCDLRLTCSRVVHVHWNTLFYSLRQIVRIELRGILLRLDSIKMPKTLKINPVPGLEAESIGLLSRKNESLTLGVFGYLNDEWKPLGKSPNESTIGGISDMLEQYYCPKIAPMNQKHKRNALRKRRMRVTSMLGLNNARVSFASINDYRKRDIQCACNLSELSYHSPEAVAADPRFSRIRSTLQHGFPICVQGSEACDPQATLWNFKDTRDLYISFRGNHNAKSVMTNLGIFDASGKSIGKWSFSTTHLSDFRALAPFIKTLLHEYSKSFSRIIVTGHGLGGALATFASPFISEMVPDVEIELITFGSPKVEFSNFFEFFQSKVNNHVRVVHSSDPLPYLPDSSNCSHLTDALNITRAGFCEKWDARTQASPQVMYGIGKLDFDTWNWQQNAAKYRRRVNAAVQLGDKGTVIKKYNVPPSRGEARGA